MARNVFVSSTINDAFDICNEYMSDTFEYYGWQSARDASWRIMKKDVGTGVYTYVYGSSGYPSNWTDMSVVTSLVYRLPYLAYNV
jgi:hypothetical protein